MLKAAKALILVTALGAGVSVLGGCSTAQKGAAGTGLAGGIAGAVVGNNWVPIGPTTGAVVGGSSGAAIGGLVGDAYDQLTEEDMERELQNLRAELQARETELAALRSAGPTEQDLAEMNALRQQIGELESALAAARADAEQRAAQLAEQNDRLQNQMGMSEAERQRLLGEIEKLQGQKGLLEQSVETLEQEAERLRAQLRDRDGRLASLEQEIGGKRAQLSNLEGELEALRTSLSGKEEALGELRSELADLNVQLEETSRGLSLTILDSLLFEPGEAYLTAEGATLVGEVAAIINERFPNRELLIEGHTDNQPIVHSGWRSNWELGAARALTILHELVDFHSVDPAKVSATSMGEFRPQSTNATTDGRRANRRAVIVILPEKIPFERQSLAAAN